MLLHHATLYPPPTALQELEAFVPAPKTSVLQTKAIATTNSALIRCGQMVAARPTPTTRAHPHSCLDCGAVFNALSLVARGEWQCEFCGRSNAAGPSAGLPAVAGADRACYTLQSAASCSPAPLAANMADLPMVVFCVDISGSMDTAVKGHSSTRLQCAKAAVHEQLKSLRQHSPTTVPVIVAFGSELTVFVDGGRQQSVTLSANGQTDTLLEQGRALAPRLTCQVSACGAHLETVVGALRTSGCTALGPALALAVGITSTLYGAKVVLCTDGCANVGVGSVQGKEVSPFYADIARRALENGTTISVITMEGEDCAMENLGTAADISRGQVDIVDPLHLARTVQSMLRDSNLAARAECSVLVGGARWQQSRLGGADIANGARWSRATVMLGSLNANSDLTLAFHCDDSDAKELDAPPPYEDKENIAKVGNECEVPGRATPDPTPKPDTRPAVRHIPIQVQLRYELPCGEQQVQVLSFSRPITGDTDLAEASAFDASVVGLEAIHASACLAQAGDYQAARINLISTLRLLQRAMRSAAHQEAYLSFVTQAENLDQFMREAQAMQSAGRDDEASKAMFQMKSLSLEQFACGRTARAY
jgi:Mg-chelatase subunit ChlD